LLTESYVTPWEGGDQPTGIVVELSGAVSSVECLQVIGELQSVLEDKVVNLFWCTVVAFA
jgi:hypothetical protein